MTSRPPDDHRPPLGREAIRQVFNAYFSGYRMSFPADRLDRSSGAFEQNGWEVQYRFGAADGIDYLECLASHRLTNDRLYRIYSDGRVEMEASSSDGLVPQHDRQFQEEMWRRGYQ